MPQKRKYPRDRYKEKECPKCGKKHKKQGPFCSRSCGAGRTFTEEQKNHFRIKNLEYHHQTPEGLAFAKMMSKRQSATLKGEEPPVVTEEFAVNIPDIKDFSDYKDDFPDWEIAENW